jgi:hypothetical protein
MNVDVECLETISDGDDSEYTNQAISH